MCKARPKTTLVEDIHTKKANNILNVYKHPTCLCLYVQTKELISQYVSKYESFYNQLYAGKTFEPKVLFKQIFSKDLSNETAQTLSDKYKAILAEPDFNIF